MVVIPRNNIEDITTVQYSIVISAIFKVRIGWGPDQKAAISGRAYSYPSSGPLPASGSVCESLLALAPQAPGLTAEVPGLAPRSLRFSGLLKKFCSTLCCAGLGAPPGISDVGAPASLPRPGPALLPSISARVRSTVGSEKDDELKGPTRPAGGGADASGEVRKMPRGS